MIIDVKIICVLYFINFLGDNMIIGYLRQIQRDMLIGNRNRKSERKIYSSQDKKSKFTLCFIRPYLKKYRRQFEIWHRIYYVLLAVTIIKYVSLIIVHLLSVQAVFIYLIIAAIAQILFDSFLRVFIFTQGLNTNSKYAMKD